MRVNCRNRFYHDVALYLPPNEFMGLGRLVVGRATRASPTLSPRARAEALELEALFPLPSAASSGSSASIADAASDAAAAAAVASLRAKCSDARAPHNPLLLRPRAFTHALDGWGSERPSSSSCSSSLNLHTMVRVYYTRTIRNSDVDIDRGCVRSFY